MQTQENGRRVLVVEDDMDGGVALKHLLESEGYIVELAGDGGEAMELARRFRPDLILLDLVLPRVNGFDTATLLKREPATEAIPIVAVTASWIATQVAALQELGFETALRKPIPPDALIELVSRLTVSGLGR
jgi:CheY-like chemotaxis protein